MTGVKNTPEVAILHLKCQRNTNNKECGDNRFPLQLQETIGTPQDEHYISYSHSLKGWPLEGKLTSTHFVILTE